MLRGSNSPIDAIISTPDANGHPYTERKDERKKKKRKKRRCDQSLWDRDRSKSIVEIFSLLLVRFALVGAAEEREREIKKERKGERVREREGKLWGEI